MKRIGMLTSGGNCQALNLCYAWCGKRFEVENVDEP